MPALETLHAEILRNPDSDEPRIAFAEAIRDSDPPRAELIRVQLQIIQSLRANAPVLDRSDGYTRERILLDKHKDGWIAPVAAVRGVKHVGLMRGFPEYVRMTARDFLDQGERLYALAPIRPGHRFATRRHWLKPIPPPMATTISSSRCALRSLHSKSLWHMCTATHTISVSTNRFSTRRASGSRTLRASRPSGTTRPTATTTCTG